MATSSQSVHKLYKSVIDDVINNVREAFLDEGVEEPVLQDLKQIWESKLIQSRAIDLTQPQAQHSSTKFKGQDSSRSYQSSQASSSSRHQIDHDRNQPQVVLQGAPSSQSTSGLSSSAVAATAALQQNILHLQSQQQLQNVPSYTIQQQGAAGSAPQTFPAYQIQTQQQQGGVVGYPPIIIQPGTQSNAQQSHIMTTSQGVMLPQGTIRLQSSGDQPSIVQVDGANDSSDDDEDDFDEDEDDDKDDDDDDDDKENDDGAGEDEEDPLNSADDVSDEDPAELFESDNVVVCQYDKINRNRNKWKFTLKHGIMNLKGKDYVFNKSTGDADW